jgi:hypothetical protein
MSQLSSGKAAGIHPAAKVFEGVLFKCGTGLLGKSFFQPRRVRIQNGILM